MSPRPSGKSSESRLSETPRITHLTLTHLADLPVAAASGIVRHGGRLYVVADDSPVVTVLDEAGSPAAEIRLTDDPIPDDPKERKRLKPDLESLALQPDGRLLALGSGSTDRRERAWRWEPGCDPEEVSLTDLYARLRAEIPDLNVEGAAWSGGRLWLAQRGNGAEGANALVELADASLAASSVVAVHPYDLGDAAGVGLTFSDLAPLPDGRLLFCAVAEASESTYDDGDCVGSAVGILDPRRHAVEKLVPLAGAPKVEGVTLAGRGASLLFVADDDDPTTPAPLLGGELPV